ncbi:MAG TPA: hypothetical protein VJ755_02695 [Gemmatimonadales bacterium]|nr:hypothetical protein [Gemmatimonadales bacterium]
MATKAVRGALKGALVVCILAALWNAACKEPLAPYGIVLSTTNVAFEDTAGLPNPAPKTVTITSGGQARLSGLTAIVTYNGPTNGWLTATLSDSTAPATLTLTANVTSLPPADYQAMVSVASPSAPNTPQTITVNSKVIKPVPLIALSQSSVTFSGMQFSTDPAPQTVSITAGGHGALTGLRVVVTSGSTVSPQSMTARLSDTTAPATLTLTPKLMALVPAIYSFTVTISASSAQNSPLDLPVSFNIAPAPPITGVTIVATANMGRCGGELGRESAKVVAAANPDYVFVLGGNAPPLSGPVTTLQDYMNCYDPVFGQFKEKTFATLGDHEVDIDSIPPNYGTGLASGADAYFGAARVGPAGKNWQSFNLGSWHVITLNVQSPGGYKRPEQIAYHAGSPQFNWLYDDLRSHGQKCTLALWYESMWISSAHPQPGGNPKDGYRVQDVRGIWTVLYDGNADLVINGWPHIYERFAPMKYANSYSDPTPSEFAADSVRGIRQITTGLGGDGPINADSAVIRHPLSEYRSGGNGVLKVVLGDGVYSWEFLNTKYSHVQDAGRGKCH